MLDDHPIDEGGKIEILEHTLAAWNLGDLDGVTAHLSPDHEWDLTHPVG